MRILVLAPHPDDEVLGCGGAIARHVSEGDEVAVAVLTNAARGAPELYSDDQTTTLREEVLNAHKVLGVHYTIFEDLPAPKLDAVPQYIIARTLSALVEQHCPETVYMPHSGDRHRDHWAVNQAAQVACRPYPGTTVRRLLTYETLSETEWGDVNTAAAFVPNWFVDISKYLSRKLQAMECYVSQLKCFPNARSLKAIEALSIIRGTTAGFSAAESFVLLRELRSDQVQSSGRS
jgi:N-acetylglucosamine malate deacetylase 1